MVLLLTAQDVRSEWEWQWSVTDLTGAAIASVDVLLDRNAEEYVAFADPRHHLEEGRPRTGRVAHEAEWVRWLGTWIGKHVICPELWPLLNGETVLVRTPPAGRFLLARPLELAHADGHILARRDTVLVHESLPYMEPQIVRRQKDPVGNELRILAIFSLPPQESPLNLRRERWELEKTVRRVAARSGKRIALRVLQYGVTRKRLSDEVAEYPGWDILHISGHGTEGSLILEQENGTVDRLSATELVTLLQPVRDRLKLTVLSACHSAAFPGGADISRAFVDALLDELDSVVLAMRYPVRDTFTIEMARQFYPLLLDKNHPVDRAVRLAVPRAAPVTPSVAIPALSIATPALFGAGAIGLQLAPPTRRYSNDEPDHRTACFPNEPSEFVGRVRLLVDGSAALALDSGRTGILLHGLPNRGKSWCAMELAYCHRDSFRQLAWWAPPVHLGDMRAILSDLALAWHEQLKWPTDWVESLSQLDSWLPKMRRDLADGRTLVVLDGLHSMLSRSAHWKDPRFAQLVKALCDHSGDSRAILTSRLIPVDIPDGILRREVGQLPRADLVLRLQASPRLRTLVGEVEVDRSGDVVGAFSPAAEDLIALLEVRPQLIEPLVADTVDVPKVREFASTLKLTEHERNALDIALRPVSSDHASVADRG